MTETVSSEDGRTVLRMERRLAHPPAKVWRALTEPSELSEWFPALVEVDLRLGGRIAFFFTRGEDDFVTDPDNTGRIRVFEPPRLLEYTWGAEVLRWELTDIATDSGDGCLLVLTATYDDRPGSASFTAGWLGCFAALERVLGGSTVPAQDYADLHEHYVKAYGLDRGEVVEGPATSVVRFERQLVRPKEQAWAAAAGAGQVAVGAPPPAGFVAKGIDADVVRSASEPVELSYGTASGPVHWQLRRAARGDP